MTGLEQFFAEFSQYYRDRQVQRILDLYVAGEISGWSLEAAQGFRSREMLKAYAVKMTEQNRTEDVIQHPVLVFGNKKVCCLVTDMEITPHSDKNGQQVVADVRSSWFLEWMDGAWRTRHGHTSLAVETPEEPQAALEYQDNNADSVFIQWLEQRARGFNEAKVSLLTDLISPSDGLHYGLCQGESFRSKDELARYYHALLERFTLKVEYQKPVVFVCGEFACLSCQGDMHLSATSSQDQHWELSPVRSTFFLEQCQEEGNWFARHSHSSLPVTC